MQRGFTKLFNTIVTSTIWQEDDKTRIVWITMLAIADAFGNVFAAIPGLASVANVSIEASEKAVLNLLAPDEYSRTKDFEGRRIEAIDGGWHILNYGKYRKMMDEEERREYKAKWARESRRQKRTIVDNNGQAGTERRLCGHRQRQSTEAEEVHPLTPSRGKCPSLKEAVDFLGSETIGTEFFDYYESNGWRVGRNPMKDWKAAARRWKRTNHASGNVQQLTRFQDRKKRQEQLQEQLNSQFRSATKDAAGRAIFTEAELDKRATLHAEMMKLA